MLSIVGATEVNNINYVDRQNVTVQIYASDDKCQDTEIKYYMLLYHKFQLLQ